MRLNKILSLVLVATLVLSITGVASAQRIGVGFTKIGHHSSISVGLGFGYSHNYYNTYCAPTYVVERCWVPGHYETVCEQVWIPGCEQKIWVEPVYQTVCDPCCGTRQVIVNPGYFRTVIVSAGHYETRSRTIWVEGFYR